ncbi:MAG: potassium transporter TrkA [Chloroflexi bacterium RBG_19FT_COMBO_56_12]|nr:MAG: potassium transporter TrkA [Chloroflexi bacterium RBG_19FT_COMBO_56_12]
MKIVIMGCGRVGEQLARLMSDEGHSVAVIDYEANALARLGPNFKGQTVCGVGFDRDVLLRAGIEQADAFAATSASDNVNIVAARIARNIFLVPRVVARLFDPRRAEIYRRLGIFTISSTTWGAERIREIFSFAELDPLMTFGSGEVFMFSVDVTPQLVGRMVRDLSVPNEIAVVAIPREGRAFLPISGSQFREGDVIHLAVLASAIDRIRDLLGLQEGG